MTDNGQRIFRVIEPSGSYTDYAACPDCDHKDDVIHQLEKDMRILKGRLTRLERDKEAEDRRHKLWDEAEALHTWWLLATGHFRAEFGVDDFRYMLPRLKEKRFGPIGVLHGIAGAAMHPQEKPLRNGRVERFDSIELICRSAAHLERFQDRAPGDPEDPNGGEWKRYLIAVIESNLTDKED